MGASVRRLGACCWGVGPGAVPARTGSHPGGGVGGERLAEKGTFCPHSAVASHGPADLQVAAPAKKGGVMAGSASRVHASDTSRPREGVMCVWNWTWELGRPRGFPSFSLLLSLQPITRWRFVLGVWCCLKWGLPDSATPGAPAMGRSAARGFSSRTARLSCYTWLLPRE